MDREHAALRLSAIGALLSAVLGIAFYFLTDSEAILLDGFFSFVGFGMGLVTIRVARLVQQPDDARFQFGYAAFEPLLNAIKGLVILAVCAFAFASAVGAAVDGGREIDALWGIAYAGIAAVACFAIAAYQRQVARTTGSALVEVDAKSWLVDGLMSVVVAGAFVIACAIEGSRWSAVGPYVDPGLVMLLVVLMVGVPVRIVLRGVGELLKVAPDQEVQRDIRSRVEAVLDAADMPKRVIRMVRIGREFWLLNHILVPKDRRVCDVADLDQIRAEIADAVADTQPGMVVDTVFTSKKEWVV
jgi:cation diffusion facilitator family transporter